MKALSLRQPWAWAILHAGKDVENREEESSAIKGKLPRVLALHASLGGTLRDYAAEAEAIGFEFGKIPPPKPILRFKTKREATERRRAILAIDAAERWSA